MLTFANISKMFAFFFALTFKENNNHLVKRFEQEIYGDKSGARALFENH